MKILSIKTMGNLITESPDTWGFDSGLLVMECPWGP